MGSIFFSFLTEKTIKMDINKRKALTINTWFIILKFYKELKKLELIPSIEMNNFLKTFIDKWDFHMCIGHHRLHVQFNREEYRLVPYSTPSEVFFWLARLDIRVKPRVTLPPARTHEQLMAVGRVTPFSLAFLFF